jgi:hypothetical protein
MMTRAAVLALACWGAACAYYNGMWSAEHLANEARSLERQDRMAEARNDWAQAAVKAESVVARHPTSRWADDALVLQGEALARSGACRQAAAPLARAVTVKAAELRERAELATAECALDADDPVAARAALAGVLESRDGARRAQAALLAGRAAALEGDATAAEWFRRSGLPAAGPERVRALLAAGHVSEAVGLIDTVARGPFREDAWAAMLGDLRRVAGPDSASQTLDRMVAGRRVPAGSRGRLLFADGEALLAAGETAAAVARFAQVAALVPDSSVGQLARVRAIRAAAARADSVPALAPLEQQLQQLGATGAAGAAAGESRALLVLIGRIEHPGELSESDRFRLAEVVRDSLGAPRLAARLFAQLARDTPASLFTPKALVAAAALWPERRDSLLHALDTAYAASPYRLALRGELSPAFSAAEDSLATALGLALGAPTAPFAARVGPPVPGPRGPLLDAPAAAPEAAPPAERRRQEPRPSRPARDDRKQAPPARPVTPRDSL